MSEPTGDDRARELPFEVPTARSGDSAMDVRWALACRPFANSTADEFQQDDKLKFIGRIQSAVAASFCRRTPNE